MLALLAEAPTHGFAIARAMAPEGEVGKVWSVRRPLVYRAIETLTGMGLVRPAADGPQPLRAAAHGPRGDARRQARAHALAAPARRPRARRALAADAQAALPHAPRSRPRAAAHRPARALRQARRSAYRAAEEAEGFDRALLLWRLESTAAAIRFVETMLGEPARARRGSKR